MRGHYLFVEKSRSCPYSTAFSLRDALSVLSCYGVVGGGGSAVLKIWSVSQNKYPLPFMCKITAPSLSLSLSLSLDGITNSPFPYGAHILYTQNQFVALLSEGLCYLFVQLIDIAMY